MVWAMSVHAASYTVTASSQQDKNRAEFAVDGDPSTRWCATDGAFPAWLMLEMEEPRSAKSVAITFQDPGAYQYRVEGSLDGKQWMWLADHIRFSSAGKRKVDGLKYRGPIRFVRVAVEGAPEGCWASIREIELLDSLPENALHPDQHEKCFRI
jgi:hypothetical protein